MFRLLSAIDALDRSKPTGGFGDGASDSRRQRAMARHSYGALFLGVAVHVMLATATG
jgi:hypothetical protein